jgi:hypothetical protein
VFAENSTCIDAESSPIDAVTTAIPGDVDDVRIAVACPLAVYAAVVMTPDVVISRTSVPSETGVPSSLRIVRAICEKLFPSAAIDAGIASILIPYLFPAHKKPEDIRKLIVIMKSKEARMIYLFPAYRLNNKGIKLSLIPLSGMQFI